MIYEIDSCLIKWLEEQPEKSGGIQQLNCFHTQGAGIALRIRQKYPQIYEADLKQGRRGDATKLGKFCVAEVSVDKFVYGYYGQYNFGMGKRQTNYEAVYNGLYDICAHATVNNIMKLGLPNRMGCMLGGGSWTVVRAIIEDIFGVWQNDLYICNYQG